MRDATDPKDRVNNIISISDTAITAISLAIPKYITPYINNLTTYIFIISNSCHSYMRDIITISDPGSLITNKYYTPGYIATISWGLELGSVEILRSLIAWDH
ncbi:hypothetical protein ATG_08920 [Desulfurococcaceae archaeon AG1]|nr:hypothetical protein ATG_08920 [Desulfurococcaceae archaeon AG1]